MRMKFTHLRWLFLSIGMAISLQGWSQGNAMQHYHTPTPPYPVDTWYLVNDGLAPCQSVNGGSPNGLYDVAAHGTFTVERWSYRRGEMYVLLTLGGGCSGWYKHDTVANKWIRVADNLTAAYTSKGYVTSNGQNIYLLFAGDVYQMIEPNEYGTYPNGWKKISVSTLTREQVWTAGCRPGSGNDIFSDGLRDGSQQKADPEAIGDTIFVPLLGSCPTERKIGKFSVQSGTWSFLTLSGLPWDLYPSNGNMTFNDSFLRYEMIFTFPIAGRFQIFMKTEESRNFGMGNNDSTLAIPSFVWAYDYAEPNPALRWKNISEGPDYNNATPSAIPYSSVFMPGFPHRPRPKPGCYNTITKEPLTSPVPVNCTTHVDWDAPTGIYSSFDKTRFYLTTSSAVNGGVYWWNGNGWMQVVSDVGDNIRPTNNGIFYKISRYSDNQFYFMDGPLAMQVGQINTFCGTDGLVSGGFRTPDDGKTWYLHYISSTQGCDGPNNVGGLYRLIFSTIGKPASTKNLHLNTGTYLGAASADNIPIGVGIGGNYYIYYGGNFNGGITTNSPYQEINLPGATSLSPGKIVVLNTKGDSIIRVVNVGNKLDELEVQDVSPFRIAVTGDFGVRILDSTATNIIWEHNLSGINLPASGHIDVDISESGQVVVARRAGGSSSARVFKPDGTLLNGTLQPLRKVLDATIKNDTVVLVGEYKGKMRNWCGGCGNFQDSINNQYSCPDTSVNKWPIRVPYVFYYSISGTSVNTIPYDTTYDFPSSQLQPDAADAFVTGANFGKDGYLYIIGEQAGPNSVFRWDGKTNYRKYFNETGKCGPPTPIQQVDKYASFSVILNPITHIGFVGKLDPTNGKVVNGTFVSAIKSDGTANGIKFIRVQTDAKGYVHVGGSAAYQSKGRSLVNINGNLVGNYTSLDATYLILAPDFRKRMFWGPFTATNSLAPGRLVGIGIRENNIALAIRNDKGNFTTTSNAIIPQSFNGTTTSLKDAYLAVFYQDIWNHAKNDSVKDKLWPSDTIFSPEQLAWKAEFETDKRKACVGQNIIFTNKSVGDSILTWDFGLNASLLPGTQGTGPFSVTYSSAGYKTIRLDALLKNGSSTYNVKHEYIQVVPPTLALSGQITGPSTVCPGSEVVYSVPATDGVTKYNWTFPPNTQILYGIDGPSVRVVFGSSGGTVQVTGTYACGTTAALTKSVTIAPKSESKVILVTKESNANTIMTFDGTGDYFEAAYDTVRTVARDSSGNNRHLIRQNGILIYKKDNSARGTVANFHLPRQYFTSPTSLFPTSSSSSPVSVSAWIRPTKVSGSNVIISQRNNGGNANKGIAIRIVEGQLSVERDGNGCDLGTNLCNSGATLLNANQWYHIAFVKEGSGSNQAKLYLNGALVGQGTHGSSFQAQSTLIGISNDCGSFQGDIDAVAFWNVALLPTDVSNIYNNSLSAELHKHQYPSHTNIIAEYDFNNPFTGFTGVYGQENLTSFTTELWVRPDNGLTFPATLLSWGVNPSTQFSITIRANDTIRVERGNSQFDYSYNIVDGQWHHIAVAVNKTNMTVYIDGLERTSNNNNGNNRDIDGGAVVRVGIRSHNLSNPFKGQIDDLRIWDTTILSNHIKSYMGTTNLLSHPRISNLIYHIHNNNVGVTFATDYTSNPDSTLAVGNATWANDSAYIADTTLKNKLESKGFTVDMVKAGEMSSNGSEATCGGLVYVSSTAISFLLGEKLKEVIVPTIVAQPRSYGAMGMVPSGSSNFGSVTSGTQVNVTDKSIYAGLASNIPSTGNQDVYASPGQIFWGTPNANAISVAQTTTLSSQKTVFGYEVNSNMIGGFSAPARRVGFFLNTYDVTKLKPQYGDSLFNRAICWVLNNCPTSNTITTNAVSPTVYCPGDSITVPFTTTGTFSLSSNPLDLPNNVIRLDAAGTGSNSSPEVLTVSISGTGAGTQTGNNSINNAYIWFNKGYSPASVPASVSWVFNVPYTGVYRIKYNIPNDPNTLNSNATLRVVRPDTATLDLTFNMQANKNTLFVIPGTYNFKQGEATLTMLNTGTNSTRIVADAVELELVSVDTPVGNDFLLQLSDKNGSFASPIVIGKLEDVNVSSGTVKGKLPTFLPQGSDYKVRVVSTVPALVGTATPTNITINTDMPQRPDSIIGNTFACADATIQGYKVVNPPLLASGYEWDIPLGASFIGPNNLDSVTIQFNVATTNDIAVRKIGVCAKSPERTLKVVLSSVAPPQPDSINGKTVVCNAMTNEVYTIPSVPTASSYMWTLPPGAVAVGSVTGNSITVNYAGALQGASQITVKAVNPCGESVARTLNVTVDSNATVPPTGSINGPDTLCPLTSNVLYTVTPVAGALGYIWSVSGTGASIDTVTTTSKNQVKLTVGSTNVTLSVQWVSPCGTSTPTTKVIQITPSSQKKALIVTDITPTSAGEDSTKSRLEQMGYAVDFVTSGMPITSSTYCYNLIMLSTGIDDNNNQSNTSIPANADTTGSAAWNGDDDSEKFKNLPVPMMVANAYSWNLTGLARRYRSSASGTLTQMNLTNATHPIGSPLAPTGNKTIVTSATRYAVAQDSDLPTGATPLAIDAIHNNNLIWAIDSGGTIFGPTITTAPARRVAFLALGHTDKDNNTNFANSLTGDGLTLFQRSVCWVTNSCDPMSITLTSVSGTTFCAGEQITVQFYVTGAIGANNKFQLQISDSLGNFTSPITIDSITSNTTGTKSITANLPLSLVTGTGYKVRIRATNNTLSNASANLTINAVPAQASSIIGTSNVCPAQSALTYNVTNTPGVTYNWTVPVGASITSGQGTNSIVANMSGATSGIISVTTTQGGCTNTNARTLSLNFISDNFWTGSVDSAWENVGNWSCGYLPTATTDVTINTSSNYPIISVAGAVARNLTVNAGSVTLATGGTLSLTGNLTAITGTFSHTGGTLIMNGTTAQTITRGAALTLQNLTIDNSAGLTLGTSTNTTINGTLNFINGRLTIGNNNLTFGTSAVITGVDATRYIVVPDNVSATTFVKRQVPTGGTDVFFPIGNSTNYNPVTIANNGTTADVQVRTFSGVYENGKSGVLATEKAVNRSWEIVPSTYDANLNIKFQWTSGQHLPLFLTSFAVVRTNTAPGSWVIHTPASTVTGSGVSEMSALGVTGSAKFPVFSIASTNTTLPPILNDVVLMVVGSNTSGAMTPTKADTIIYDTLVARGYNVTMISDAEEAPTDVNNCKFIWIASSVNDNKLGTKYRDVSRPVVVNAPVLSNMGLAMNAGSYQNAGGPQRFYVRNTSHLLSKGVTSLGSMDTPLNIYKNANSPSVNTLIFGSASDVIKGIVYDSSGNNRNAYKVYAHSSGSITSVPNFVSYWHTTDPAPGRNSALNLSFAGIIHRFVVANYKGVTGAMARSFSAWIKTDSSGTIVSWGNDNGANGQSITFYVNASGKLALDFNHQNTGEDVVGTGTSPSVNDGQWHHVAFTMPDNVTPSNTSIKLYVDGVPIPVVRSGSDIIDISSSDKLLQIGRSVASNSGAVRQYKGLIDDVALWSDTLSDADVSAIYNTTNGVAAQKWMYPKQSKLQLEYDFIKVREPAIIPILQRKDNTSTNIRNITFAGFEEGKDAFIPSLPARRVLFPISQDGYENSNGGILYDATTRQSFKKVLDNTLCWITNTCPTSIEITTGTIPTTSYCQGQSINVPFSSPNTFNAGNIFIAELSKANGTFPGVDIGTLAGTSATGIPISATIPTDSVGTNFRIRVRSTNPVATLMVDNGSNIEIKVALSQPSVITGPSSVCTGQPGLNYSVVNNPSATFYTWALPSGATGSSLTNSITVNMGTATSGSISVTASNGTCSSPARTLPLTFNTENVWTGSVDTNWFNASNWSCGYVPNASSNVRIPNTSKSPIITTGSAICRKLTVEDSLTISGGTLTLSDTLKVTSSAYFVGNGGTVEFNGSSLQYIVGSGLFRFHNLTINNMQGVRLAGPDTANISGMLTLNGNLFIGTKNLIMECGANVIGASPSNYIVADNAVNPGGGFLIIKYCTTGSKFFPVGTFQGTTNAYNPVTINITAGAPTAMKVRLFIGLFEHGMAGPTINQGALNRTWEISPYYGTPTANMRFNWNHTRDALVNFTLPNFAVIRRNAHTGSSPWVDLTTSNYTNEGSDRHSVEALGVSTFSNFTAFAGASVLPVDLLEFSGANVNGVAILRWRTTNELNNKGFYVEKSENGINGFNAIGFVAGTQHSSGVQTYTFVDKDFDADAYYRLRIEGQNGIVTYSRNVVFIGGTATTKQAEFVIFPNPTEGKVTIEYTSRLVGDAKVKLDMASATGSKILSAVGSLPEVNQNLNGVIEKLSSGVYVIRIEYGATVQHIKLMKE